MTVTAPQTTGDAGAVHWHRPGIVVFFAGLSIWIGAVVITATTKDDILIPTVILLGSFLVPVTVIVTAFHREQQTQVHTGLTMPVMMEAFILSGMVGVIGSALIEVYTLPKVAGTFIAVALIEETCKGLVLVLVSLRLQTRKPLDGLVLGAIVGAGFAAFESAGYAFDAYIKYGASHPFLSLLQTEINRAILSPFGHIIWTGILGGALFAAAGPTGRFRINRRVVGTFIGVVVLHSLWDQGYGWALIITRGITHAGWHFQWPNAAAWVSTPDGHQLRVFNSFYNGLLLVLGIIGVWWYVHEWRSYKRAELAEESAAGAVATAASAGGASSPLIDLRAGDAQTITEGETTRR